jgi:enamine deaminase RidA (YjgF/YER057c/UK114 family)
MEGEMNRNDTSLALAVVFCTLGVMLSVGTGYRPAAIGQERSPLKKELVNPPHLPRSPYYAQAVGARGGKTVYISGQWACTPKGELVGKGDVRAQAGQAFKNLRATLTACGATPAAVVKINVYMVGYKETDLAALDEGLLECFGKERKFASTLVGAQALARDGMLVEVDAIAVIE